MELVTLIETVGYIGVFFIIFAESGLLFGFFIAAVLGDNVGYAFGKHVGKRLFKRQDSLFFHQKNVQKAQDFYEKYGPKTIVIARFIPVVRTFALIVAGVGTMNYKVFVAFNLVEGVLWA